MAPRSLGGCSIISRSTIAARSRAGGSSARPNMTRCANSRLRSPSGSAPCRRSRSARRLIADARALEAAVARKAPPEEVDRLARGLGRAAARRLSGPAGAVRRARSRRRRPALCRSIAPPATAPPASPTRRWRGGIDPPPIAFADRDRAARAQPVRALPGDRAGARRDGDAELRLAARGGPLGARFPCRPLRLSRGARSAGRRHLGRRSGPARAHPQSRGPGLDHPGHAGPRVRRGEGECGDRLSARQSRRAAPAPEARSRWRVAHELLRQSARRLSAAASASEPASWRWPPISTASSRSRHC